MDSKPSYDFTRFGTSILIKQKQHRDSYPVSVVIPIAHINRILIEEERIALYVAGTDFVHNIRTTIPGKFLEQFAGDLYEPKSDAISKLEKRISGLQQENDVLQEELEDLRAEIQEIKARLAQPAVAQTDLLNISGNCAEPIT